MGHSPVQVPAPAAPPTGGVGGRRHPVIEAKAKLEKGESFSPVPTTTTEITPLPLFVGNLAALSAAAAVMVEAGGVTSDITLSGLTTDQSLE